MRDVFLSCKESVMELKKLMVLVTTAMLTALNTVLGLFTVMVGTFIKISFSYLPIGLTGMLYGPVPAGILGGVGDIINYLIKPAGTFFPGFTLNGIITGFIYGLFFYKQTISFKRVFLAKLCVVLLVDLCLTTAWLSMLYGKGFFVLLPMRAVKAAILLPFESSLLYFLLTRITLILKNISPKTPQTQVKD